MSLYKFQKNLLLVLAAGTLLTSCFHKKKYENPITKDTVQPDKVLFDRAIGDVEHGRFEVARLTLNTLINTYDTSEYLAKAKLAIADSWYREGGAHGLAQAEAEYKDFILFYPTMEEAAESQWKVCQIHYKQMEKVDRDSSQAVRAEDECKVLVVQFPNSKYVPQAQQMLRNTQEVLADKEFRTGAFYHTKGAFPAAANRLNFVAEQYPLYSGAAEALWQAADSFERMGDRFENQSADNYTRIVKDYPLSSHADEAKEKLTAMKRPVPAADPAAVARMKYEEENFRKNGMLHNGMSMFRRGPETNTSAKTGAPAMQVLRPPTPVSVPASAAGTGGGTTGTGVATSSDVSAGVSATPSDIDTKPDARQNPAATQPGTQPPSSESSAQQAATASTTQPLPTNRPAPAAKPKKKSKKQLKQEQEAAAAASQKQQ
ncbi:MAG: outer membrane protein assembly factor BamD [Acidobacteriota bacterium]|nr:outer membrane protein assembly factor BamD [Acidobacteriota bacterium]